jgi:peptide/nickel transport system substrate-binding protein
MIKRAVALMMVFALITGVTGCKQEELVLNPVEESAGASMGVTDPGEESSNPKEYQRVVISTGAFAGSRTPLFADTVGDLRIEDLTQVKLLGHTSSGAPDYEGSIATFRMSQNEAENTTTVTVRVKDGIVFADSADLTVDDIIFTYYVIADSSYNGYYRPSVSILKGLSGYRVNNTGADSVRITDEMVAQALSEDADVMLAVSDNIIRPVLEKERQWCEDNWSSYADRGYGSSAADFFISLYILPMMVDYDASGKDFDRIVEEAVEIYGADYRSLGMYYRGSSSYFEDEALVLSRKKLEEKYYTVYGGTATDVISGIQKVDDHTVNLVFESLNAAEVEEALSIPVLSLNHYGNRGYNYESAYFGVNRGDVSSIIDKGGDFYGAGRYLFRSGDESKVRLVRNDRYYKLSKSDPYEVVLFYMGSSATKAALKAGTLDAGNFRIESKTDIEELIPETEAQGIQIKTVGNGFCSYLGVNGSAVKVGDSQDSEESKCLREALLMALAVNRDHYRTELGMSGTASTLNSMASVGSWAYNIDRTEPYAVTPDGSSLYSFDASFDERQAKTIEEIKNLLLKAGYTFSDRSNKFSDAPDGAKMIYTIGINPEIDNKEAVVAVIDQASEIMNTLGLRFRIADIDTNEDFDNYMSNNRELWVSWYKLDATPDAMGMFSSAGDGGLYGDIRPDVEAQCKYFASEFNKAAAFTIYEGLMDALFSYGMVLPLYENNSGIGLRTSQPFTPSRWFEPLDAPGVVGQVTIDEEFLQG